LPKIKYIIFLFFLQTFLFSYDLLDYLYYAAKELKKEKFPKVGLVLGGGGARGLSHIGVLKVWEEEKLPLDCISGTSAGSLIGGLYASGIKIKELEKMAIGLGWSDIATLKFSPSRILNIKYIFSQGSLKKYLDGKIGDKKFFELKIPFACVSADLRTGEKIIFKSGNLSLAVRASSAIPGIFEPVYYRQRLLVDGGIIDKVPVDAAEMLGAQFIVAVDVGAKVYREEFDNIVTILTQVVNLQSNELSRFLIKDADVVIEPDVSSIKVYELNKWKRAEEEGIKAARDKLREVKEKLILKVFEE